MSDLEAMEVPITYMVKLSWGWGRNFRFSEVSEFTLRDLDDLDDAVRSELHRIANHYAFDCSRIDYPLHPTIYSIQIIPVAESMQIENSVIEQYRQVLDKNIDSVKASLEERLSPKRKP